jgi:hypothetical protein
MLPADLSKPTFSWLAFYFLGLPEKLDYPDLATETLSYELQLSETSANFLRFTLGAPLGTLYISISISLSYLSIYFCMAEVTETRSLIESKSFISD